MSPQCDKLRMHMTHRQRERDAGAFSLVAGPKILTILARNIFKQFLFSFNSTIQNMRISSSSFLASVSLEDGRDESGVDDRGSKAEL